MSSHDAIVIGSILYISRAVHVVDAYSDDPILPDERAFIAGWMADAMKTAWGWLTPRQQYYWLEQAEPRDVEVLRQLLLGVEVSS